MPEDQQAAAGRRPGASAAERRALAPARALSGSDADARSGPSDPSAEREVLAAMAEEAGLRRVHFVAWRDLDDPEAGGSELHAHRIASLWAAAGIDVTFRTSAVLGQSAATTREGYGVERRSTS